MDANPYDPRVLARRHYRENLWLRDTLESVARELERMAARGQGESDILLGRAGWVRQRLHQGVPEEVDCVALGLASRTQFGGRTLRTSCSICLA